MGIPQKEIQRLSEWIKSKGMTTEDVVDCLRYITTGKQSADKNEYGVKK